MIGGGTARNEQYQRLVFPLVTLSNPVGSDINLVSFARFEFLELQRIFLRTHVKPVLNAGRQSLTFLAKLRIIRPTRLRLKCQLPLALPEERMGNIWVRFKKAHELLGMVNIR